MSVLTDFAAYPRVCGRDMVADIRANITVTTGYHCSVWDGFFTISIEGSGGDEEDVGQDGQEKTWAGVWTSGGWTE